ncbi:uncharacterized protein [Nicotiana sylvestris]|uniref:Reverse transcriptase zinc-binding domain-containing protein n=2 Tax=Nicotiana TaxID=4085 RepID=A0A1S3YL91_TOBAC|nr:PREDICTED: uncharacterized protein LOC104214751 [Nicotiana sylvestris]XP_016452813.1 PREDICTED: uncharacterized protein LOC107777330 [Nicotiana tabacum]
MSCKRQAYRRLRPGQMAKTNRKYTIMKGYSWLRGTLDTCQWGRWVWNVQNVTKYSFICWLMMQGKLLTKDKLTNRGISSDGLCVLCGNAPESIEHLSYECHFFKLCINEVLQLLKISITNYEGRHLWKRIGRKMGSKFRKEFSYAILVALSYHIWRGRNEALWKCVVPRPSKICAQIKKECKVRVMEIINKIKRDKDRRWIEEVYS